MSWQRFGKLCALFCISLLVTACTSNNEDALFAKPGGGQSIQSISVTPVQSLTVVGLTTQYTATAVFENGEQSDITERANWSASNSAIASIDRNGVADALSIGVTDIIASYNGASGSANLVVSNAKPDFLLIQPVAPIIPIQQSLQATALLFLDNGAAIDVTSDVIWRSFDPSIATVSDDKKTKGFINTIKKGVTEIEAKLSAKNIFLDATTSVEVSDAALISMQVLPDVIRVAKGTVGRFKAFGTYSDGNVFDISEMATWRSSAPTIGSVVEQGVDGGAGTALSPGNTTVTASFSNKQATAQVEVTNATMTALTIEPSTVAIPKGTRTQLKAVALFSDKTSQIVTLESTWSSKNTSIAAVDSNRLPGLLEGVTKGQTEIKAQFNGFEAVASVVVGASTIKTLQIAPQNSVTPLGTVVDFSATAFYFDGTSQVVTEQAVWQSSNYETVNIIPLGNLGGQASGLEKGSVTISAYFDGQQATTSLTVADKIAESIKIIPLSIETPVGSVIQLDAYAIYSDNSWSPIDTEAIWSSDNDTIVDVTPTGPEAGLTVALNKGDSNITARWSRPDGQSLTDTISYTVSDARPISLSIIPSIAEVYVSSDPDFDIALSQRQFEAIATLSNGKLLDVSDQVFWSIDNTAIATITQLGLANGISPGKVTISATLNTANGDISNTATLRVLEPRVTIEEIQVKPYRTQLLIDGKQQYKATALLSNGDTPDVTNIVSWTIDDTSIAHITTKGEATAVSEGKAIVTASLRYQDALAQGSAELFVKAPDITVDTLFVTPLTETVFISDTIQYKAEALLSDGNRVTVTDQVNWRSSDESKAFISNTGLVNALAPGIVDIDASLVYQSAITPSNKAELTIKPPASIACIQITPRAKTLLINDRQQYQADALITQNNTCKFIPEPTGEINTILGKIDVTNLVIWSSKDANIVSIDPRSGFAIANSADNADSNPDNLANTIISADLNIASTLKDSTDVFVEPPAVTVDYIDVTPKSDITNVGQLKKLTATAYLSNGKNTDVSDQVQWQSSDDDIAVLQRSDGTFLGAADGEATISATLTYQADTVDDSVKLEVIGFGISPGIEVIPSILKLPVDGERQFKAFAVYSNGSRFDVTDRARWSSSQTSVLEISPTGLAKGISLGTSVINVSIDGGGNSVGATVVNPDDTLSEIKAIPDNIKLFVDDEYQFKAESTWKDGTVEDVTNTATWTSFEPDLFFVEAPGLIKAIASTEGVEEYARVSLQRGSSSTLIDDIAITVFDETSTIDTVAITNAPPLLYVGSIFQFNAFATLDDADQNKLDITTSNTATWSSADSSILAISNPKGVFKALKKGTTDVTLDYVKFGQSFTETVSVSVTDATPKSIKINPENPANIPLNATQQFTAMLTLDNNDEVDATNLVEWLVDDVTGEATIDNTGLLTANKAGTATVTANFKTIFAAGVNVTIDP